MNGAGRPGTYWLGTQTATDRVKAAPVSGSVWKCVHPLEGRSNACVVPAGASGGMVYSGASVKDGPIAKLPSPSPPPSAPGASAGVAPPSSGPAVEPQAAKTPAPTKTR